MSINKRTLNFCIKALIFALLLIFIWTPIHEFVHKTTINILGHKAVYSWSFFPHVSCLDCDKLIRYQYLLYIISPYLLDGIILILFWLFRNRFLQYSSWLAYFDITGNFIFILPSVIFNLNNDFLNMNKIGFFYIAVILFILSTLLFYRLNKRKIMG